MAGQPINVTGSVVTPTFDPLKPYWQDAKDAIDVTGYRGARFDFGLKVYTLAGTSPSLTVKLYSSMYHDDDGDVWDLLGAFSAVTTSNTACTLSVSSGMLRYVRWKLEYTNMTLVTLEILGMVW